MKPYPTALGVFLAFLGSGAGTASGFQVDQLPRPTGPFGVGTTIRHWTDSTRQEHFTGDPHDLRRLDVYVWYPAALRSGRSPTPYVPNIDRTERVMGSDYAARVRAVNTNSTVEPALSRQPARFGVVVFSHGLGSLPMHYTALAEELASHGYLVASVNHSFGSAATVLGRRGAQPLHRSWRSAFEITPEADRFLGEAITEWAADIIFVINQLAAEHRVSTEFFGGRLDLSHIVAAGHSHGGSAALFAGQIDPRIKAVINLDGPARSIHTGFSLNVPVLWMFQDRSSMDSAAAAQNLRASAVQFRTFMRQLDAYRDTLMSRAPEGSYVVSIAGSRGRHFSDLPVVFGEPRSAAGVIDPSRVVDIVRTYVVRFLAVQAGQANAGELERLAQRYPEVELVKRRK